MDERINLLAMVASLYYNLNQSQTEIAHRLELSPSKVSRLIKEARAQGVVEIHVHMPIPRELDLEQRLIEQFGLKDAYVLKTSTAGNEKTKLHSLGRLAATYLRQVITSFNEGTLIGVAWGTGVHASVSALPNSASQQLDVVQLMGGVGALNVDGPDLARMVAEKLGGRHYDLHAPVLVENGSTRDLFLEEPTVRDGIVRAQSVQLAITGIGAVHEDASSFLRVGLLNRNDLSRLRNQGLVGELCGRFFDSNGRTDPYEFNRRVIGIELDKLRAIPRVLAIARGPAKVQSILGALRGGYLTILATDDRTARAILEANRELLQA